MRTSSLAFRAVLCVLLLQAGCSDSGSSSEDAGLEDAGFDGGTDDAGDPGSPCGTERIREDVGIPTLDGHELSAFVDRPSGENCSLPTILLQTPYNKENAWALFFGSERPDRPLFASPDYNFVVVDWRGFYGSSGLPNAGDGAWMAQDSYDTVEWIAAQSWSDGQVGTWGVSALCGAQYRTASGPVNNDQHPDFADGPPPHLTAMVPIMCPMRSSFAQIYPGGVLRHEVVSTLDVLGYGVRLAYENNPRQNWLWDLVDTVQPPGRMKVPAMVVSGWWDLYPTHTVDAYRDLVNLSDPSVRDQHRLVIGPWFHFATGGSVGEGALRPLTGEEWQYMDTERRIDIDSLAFFDHHLRGIENEVPGWARVRYYHQNAGWQESDRWPPDGLSSRILYLDDQNQLVDDAPAAGSVVIPFDPSDPSPTVGGPTLSPYNCVGDPNPLICTITPDEDKLLLHGPASQATLLDRNDQVTFMTEPLAEPLVILGEMRVVADLSTSGLDCDLAVRILDVDPAGDPVLIGDGIQRMSARDDNRNFSEVAPNQRYTLTVKVIKDFAYTIEAGHRFGIMLSMSNWPLFARNPGDGAVFMESDALPNTNETFSYGWPTTTVDLKGPGAATSNTIYLDGVTRVEFGTP